MKEGNQNLLIWGGAIVAGVYLLSKLGNNFLNRTGLTSEARQDFITDRYEVRTDRVEERFNTFEDRQETKQLRQDKKQTRINADIEKIEDKAEKEDIIRDEKTERKKIRQENKTFRVEARQEAKTEKVENKLKNPKLKNTINVISKVAKAPLKVALAPAKGLLNRITSKLRKK